MEEARKWQPVVVITDHRLECACGALAIFVSGKVGDKYNSLNDVDVWCQDCFTVAMNSQSEETP